MALNRGAQHLGVNLRGTDVFMAEHSGHIFDGDIVCEGQRSEGVARHVHNLSKSNGK